MARAGHLTDDEARRLQSATDPVEAEEAIRSIRARHAQARLDVAVGDGSMTPDEAAGFLERLRHGEHSAALRSEIRAARRGGRP